MSREINEHASALAYEWRRLTRAATAVALFTAPALQALEEKRHRKFETVPFFDGI